MRILNITGAYPPMQCGVGDYTARLVKELEKIPGVTSGVLTSVEAANSPCRPDAFFPLISSWGFKALPTVIESFRHFRPDIVHLQYPASFGRVFMPNFLPLVCRAFGITVVQTWHEHPIYSQIINALPKDALVVVEPDYPEAYRPPYRSIVRHKTCVHIQIGSNIPRASLAPGQRQRIRETYESQDKRLLVYFGFASDRKGLDLLFKVADPHSDRIVLICDLNRTDPYHASILSLSDSDLWRGKCFVTGYLADNDAASILDAADAAVFPFVDGSTPRNGSILAARLQRTFVVSTHKTLRGYNSPDHTFYTAPGDVAAIRQALDCYAGKRFNGVPSVTGWSEIAARHCELYEEMLLQMKSKRKAGEL